MCAVLLKKRNHEAQRKLFTAIFGVLILFEGTN